MNYPFITVQTSILLCYFLVFAQRSKSFSVQHTAESQIGKLFSSPSDATQSKAKSLKTSDTWIFLFSFFLHYFGTIARPLQHLYFRSRCIWWDLNGASRTHLWLYLPLVLTARPSRATVSLFVSALCFEQHVPRWSGKSSTATKMSNESYSHHW